MIKKLIFAVAAMVAMMGFAFAQVDVNKADAAALDSIKGVGPKMSKVILDERTKGGDFKDWADFEKRVKGVGPKNAMKMSSAGLMVSGKSMDGAALAPAKGKMPEAKPADMKSKADMKAKPAAPAKS